MTKLEGVINKYPEGITFDKNYNIINQDQGFFVSLTDNIIKDPLPSEIKKLKDQAKKMNLVDWYFGYWKDRGDRYLDLSLHIPEQEKAFDIGKKYRQKAIFDCFTKQSIFLK